MTIAELAQSAMIEEARKALDLYCIDYPRSMVHQANARRIADQLGLSALPQRQEVAA